MTRSRPRYPLLTAAASLWLATGLWCATVPTANAQQPPSDVLFGALVMATKSDHPQPPPAALQGQAKNLEEVFGYNEFKVLGEKRNNTMTGKEDWLVSSRQFFLRVDTKQKIPGGYSLGLQLLQQDRVMVEADAKLSKERPLFIRGPFVGQGQLLILLMVL